MDPVSKFIINIVLLAILAFAFAVWDYLDKPGK